MTEEGLVNMVKKYATITVQYALIGGWHTYTSKDLYGLFSSSLNEKEACEMIPTQIKTLLKKNHDLEVIGVWPMNDLAELKRQVQHAEKAEQTENTWTKTRNYDIQACAVGA